MKHLYEYNTEEFLPVYREGVLDNKSEFITYKLKKVATKLINVADSAYYAAGGR